LLDFKAMLKNHINLAHNTNLRTIRLGYENNLHRGNWMVALLSQITSPHVEHVWLISVMHAVSDLDEFAWSSIEHLLIQPQWASLRQLTIGIHGKADLPEVRETIRHYLPTLESRGVVHIYRTHYGDYWRNISSYAE
jgi:hypothetical protein